MQSLHTLNGDNPMENELLILDTIEKNNNVTQREISKNTGISLGNVNILIKRLVKKGMIKIERINPRTVQYILTPHGFREKAEATYRYIVSSYKYINEIDRKIDLIFEKYFAEVQKHVYLFGNRDEIYEILINKLNSANMEYTSLENLDEVNAYHNTLSGENTAIIVWQPEYEEELKLAGTKYIYLLEEI
jgi:DNA-binding MarR family transcriptional regulator